MAGTASEKIDAMIAGLDDWRGPTLERLRATILAADPDIIEEWKWMGSPTWSCDGLIAVGNPHKSKIKLTFAHGAALPDLVRAAIAYNRAHLKKNAGKRG